MAEFEALRWVEREPDEQIEASRAFLAMVRTRRTVREFAPTPVPMELIENAIRAAGSAPSGANQQPWRFVVVTEAALKREIRLAAEKEERANYEVRFPEEWLAALEPFGTDWHKPFLEIAPALIVVFAIDHGVAEDGSKWKHYYVQESVGIATGFLLAALHAAGLATLTHTPSPMGFLRSVLGRPANERPFLLIPVGHPAPDCQVPKLKKKGWEEIALCR
jgi:iodotyrosine deiodinase